MLNLSRTEALPIVFAGQNAPRGTVVQAVLTSAHIEDSNELTVAVVPRSTTRNGFNPGEVQHIPPFSLTTYTWTTP